MEFLAGTGRPRLTRPFSDWSGRWSEPPHRAALCPSSHLPRRPASELDAVSPYRGSKEWRMGGVCAGPLFVSRAPISPGGAPERFGTDVDAISASYSYFNALIG